MTLEDAIRVIQIHERARQGRLRAKFMREIRQQEEREKRAALRGAPTLDPEVASVRIQKVRPCGLSCYKHLFIYLSLCIVKSRQTREMKYNTQRIAEVQSTYKVYKVQKNILTNKNKQSETQ